MIIDSFIWFCTGDLAHHAAGLVLFQLCRAGRPSGGAGRPVRLDPQQVGVEASVARTDTLTN